MNLRVAIVEDNKKIREGLAALIDGSEGFHCTDTFETAEEALRRIPDCHIDVVLMDIQLPRMSGIECVEKLKERVPDLEIMMLTAFEDSDKVFKSIVAGASGYILKSTPPAELLEAIRDIKDGGSPMSDQVARKVVEAFRQMGASSKETENLSDRETEILSYVAKGYQDREIADTLFLSIKTVRSHLRNIYRKLHVRSRTEAALLFLRK